MFYKHFTGICRKCRELIRTRKTDEDVLESGALHEMLGKMTLVSNDFVLECSSNTNTTAVPAVKYNCTQNSGVSRAQIEVASYEQSNVEVGRKRSTNSSSNFNRSKHAANLNIA